MSGPLSCSNFDNHTNVLLIVDHNQHYIYAYFVTLLCYDGFTVFNIIHSYKIKKTWGELTINSQSHASEYNKNGCNYWGIMIVLTTLRNNNTSVHLVVILFVAWKNTSAFFFSTKTMMMKIECSSSSYVLKRPLC